MGRVPRCTADTCHLNEQIQVADLTLENGLFTSFDFVVRQQLDPIWHTTGPKTRQLVGDLRILNNLLSYMQHLYAIVSVQLRVDKVFRAMLASFVDGVFLTTGSLSFTISTDRYLGQYDCVAFYDYLETIRTATNSYNTSAWAMMDAAAILFEVPPAPSSHTCMYLLFRFPRHSFPRPRAQNTPTLTQSHHFLYAKPPSPPLITCRKRRSACL